MSARVWRGLSSLLDRRPALLGGTLLVSIWVVVFSRHLFLGFTFPWDFAGKYSTSPAFVAATLGSGSFTEWVPFVGGGAPLAADPQSGLYFPVWWLLGALGVPVTVGVVTIVQAAHLPVGAFGVLVLARARSVEGRFAILAAIAFLFFGGFYGNAQHADIFRGHAYAPWILWAVTLPRERAPWRRVLWLPPLAWLMVSGAYPGQVVAFALIAAAYVVAEGCALRTGLLDATAAVLGAAAVSCALIVAALLSPYLLAEHGGILHRPALPDAAVRAGFAFHPVDLLAAYLTPFSWRVEGSIAAWAIGVPALIGLAGLHLRDLRAHVALVVAAAVSALLASLPAWSVAGEWMARAPYLFPSRFPAADAKAMLAASLLVLAAAGWRTVLLDEEASHASWRTIATAALVVVGVSLAPQATPIVPTRWPAVLGAVAVACVGIALTATEARRDRWLVVLLLLVVIDGARLVDDSRHAQGIRTWAVPGYLIDRRSVRDTAARRLQDVLRNPPALRPARVPSLLPLEEAIAGSPAESWGYLGLGYHLSDHGNFITLARWRAQRDPRLASLVLEPWRAWAWPCGATPCGESEVALPAEPWPATESLRTVRYATNEIDYRVATPGPILAIENELYFPGWQADHAGVRAVSVGGIFRGWVLPAGEYSFTARYRLPQRGLQMVLVSLAALVWIAAAWLVHRGRVSEPALGARS